MRWLNNERKRNAVLDDASHLLRRFGFVATADGILSVYPVGPTLDYKEVDAVLKRLAAEGCDRSFSEIVFELGTVEWIEVPWTAVIARFVDLARKSRARLRLVGLHGQPAAVVGFFDRDLVVSSLLGTRAASSSSPVPDNDRVSA